jgi:hypothetical protein
MPDADANPDRNVPASEINIEELREAGEDGGDLMGYFCRGHASRYSFAEAANQHSGAVSAYDRRHVRPEDVRHVWWRTVPIAGEPGCFSFQDAVPGSRGAWKATVADVVVRRRMRDTHRVMQEGARRHSIGFAQGVDWAVRLLEINHPGAAKMVLDAWKHGAGKRAEREAAAEH